MYIGIGTLVLILVIILIIYFARARLGSPGRRRCALRLALLLEFDDVAGGVEDPDLHHVALRTAQVLDATRVEFGDRGVEIRDRYAVVVVARLDTCPTRRHVDQMELGRADRRKPVAGDAGDLGPVLGSEPEDVLVEVACLVECAFDVTLTCRARVTFTAGSSSCSMNSSRMRPGASTKTMRHVPNVGPETTSGPHTTSWPTISASTSSVKTATCRKPSSGRSTSSS